MKYITKVGISLGLLMGVFITFPAFANAQTVCFPQDGCTGTSTPPAYGEILVGQGDGTYGTQATSTLNIVGTPAGNDTEVQFNDGGATGADSDFTWDKTLNKLTVTNASTTQLSIGALSGVLQQTAGVVVTALVDLTSQITGILPIANGGTNASSFGTTNGLVYFDGTRLVNDADFTFDGTNFTAGATTGTSTVAHNFKVDGNLEVDGFSLLNGTIVASGLTQGSVTFINGSGALAEDNSNFFWDNANNNLGIGTSSPYRNLSVAGTTVFDGLSTHNATTTFNDDIYFQSSQGTQQYLWTSCPAEECIALQSQSSGVASIFRMFSKDGDGTDSVLMNIWGVGTPQSNTNKERLVWGWNSGSSAYEFFTNAGGTGVVRPIDIYTSGNSNQLTLATDGNVGIGTSTPNVPLEVLRTGTAGYTWTPNARTAAIFQNSSSSGTALSIIAKSTGNSFVFFGDEASETVGQIGYNHASGLFTIESAGGGGDLFVDSAGNVGVGTSTPGYLLDVDGDFNVGEAGNAQSFFVDATAGKVAVGENAHSLTNLDGKGIVITNTAGGATGRLRIDVEDISSGYNTEIRANDTGLEFEAASNSRNISFWTGAAPAERLTVLGTGNVGINDSTPDAALDVVSSATLSAIIQAPIAGGDLRIARGTSYQYDLGLDGSSVFYIEDAGANKPFQIEPGTATNTLYLDANGTVGVGTSSPTDFSTLVKLAVEGNDPRILISDNAGSPASAWSMRSTDGLFVIRDETTGVDRLGIDTSGYLAVGLTDADEILHLRNSADPTLLIDNNDSTVTAGDTLGSIEWETNDSTATAGISAYIKALAVNSFSASSQRTALTFATTDTAADLPGVERLRIDYTGNIGIGDTTPSTPLEIETANTQGATFINGTFGEGLLVSQTNYSAGNYVSLLEGAWTLDYSAPSVRVGAMYDGGGSNLSFGTSNSYGAGITNQALWIDSGGKTGIGTTTEVAQLTVGSANVSGDGYRSTVHVQNDNYESALTLKGGSSGFLHAVVNLIASSGSNVRALGTHAYDETATRGWFWGRPYSTSDAFAINRRSTTGFSTDIADVNDADVDNFFYINSGGAVSIGTTGSGGLLTVNTGADGNVIFSGRAGGNNRFAISSAASGSHTEFYSLNNVDLRFGVGASPTDLVIKNGGNVGIGTSSPLAKLYIEDGNAVLKPNDLTDGATIDIDWSLSNNHNVVLGGNRTITFSNVVVGQAIRLYVTQDGTGSRTVTWPSSCTWGDVGEPTLDTDAGNTDIITMSTATSTATVHCRFAD